MSIEPPTIHLALPKGRMETGVFNLLSAAGIELHVGQRGYRPVLSEPGFEVKLLKPQNIVEMLAVGTRDIGFAGADWVAEQQADLVELLDTGLDPVRIVAAASASLVDEDGNLPNRTLVVASEYERLTRSWIANRQLDASFVRSYGATEVFPPEDADVIVDNTATGETLAANGLAVVDELMPSSTRLYASQGAVADPDKKGAIDGLVLSLRSVLDAAEESHARAQRVALRPRRCHRRTARHARAHSGHTPRWRRHGGQGGRAPKRAPRLIPRLRQLGATDIAVSKLEQIVP